MIIRQETPADYDAVYDMVKMSFATASFSDGTEADYLNGIRKKDTFIPELSLLAIDDDAILAQIVLYQTTIHSDDNDLTELVLSPLSVHPEFFNRRIATALVDAALTKAKEMGYNAVFLCGDPVFYQKLGFKATYHYGIHHIKDDKAEWCMVRELTVGFLDGVSGKIDIE